LFEGSFVSYQKDNYRIIYCQVFNTATPLKNRIIHGKYNNLEIMCGLCIDMRLTAQYLTLITNTEPPMLTITAAALTYLILSSVCRVIRSGIES